MHSLPLDWESVVLGFLSVVGFKCGGRDSCQGKNLGFRAPFLINKPSVVNAVYPKKH